MENYQIKIFNREYYEFIILISVTLGNEVIEDKVKSFEAIEIFQHLLTGLGHRDKLKVFENAIAVETAQDTM